MANRDGNGWVRCAQGHRHWGRYGAAGLLACAPDQVGQDLVLLQRRSRWVNHGRTWAPPGGARDSHEPPVAAALREAAEECAVPAELVSIRGVLTDDHGGWSYRTVLAAAATPFAARAASGESSEVAWVPAAEVAGLALHPGFAAQWPVLRDALAPLTVIVDAANVMGSRPDGWWRDRAGAATRLGGELSALASQGLAGQALAGQGLPALPDSLAALALERWYPRYVLVVEGAARRAVAPGEPQLAEPVTVGSAPAEPGRVESARVEPVQLVAAERSGDDAIVRLAAQLPGRRLVVTADRELRARCQAAGAAVTGPRWLLGLLRHSMIR
jgi:8-oxo-dGTP diphosphatase